MSMGLETIAQVATERMLSAIAVGTLVTMAAWVVLRIARRTSAGARFAIWFSVLMAVFVLPVGATLFNNYSTAVPTSAWITLPGFWAYYVFVVWAVIAGLGLLRVAFGIWRLHQIRRECFRVEMSRLEASALQTIARHGPKRAFSLLESDKVRVPIAMGFFRPAVVLPSWCLNELSSAELSATLIHELAHLRRWDDWTNLLQKILRALFFFHPAVWWLENRLALEREMACDDLVLAATDDPHAYAQCLVSLAEKSFVRRSLALAQGAVHRFRHMSLRISQIMDAKRQRAPRIWTPALALMAALFGIGFVGMLHAPTLVAFQQGVPGISAASAGSTFVPPMTGVESRPVRLIPRALKAAATKTPQSIRKPALLVAKTKTHRRTGDQSFIMAKSNREAVRTPPVVPVKASLEQGSDRALGSMLLVMHDEVVDPSGRVVWTMTVWRVTVYRSTPAMVSEGTVSKSI